MSRMVVQALAVKYRSCVQTGSDRKWPCRVPLRQCGRRIRGAPGGNSINQSRKRQKTYMPVNAAAIRADEEARKLLSEEHSEFKRLKLGPRKVETEKELIAQTLGKGG